LTPNKETKKYTEKKDTKREGNISGVVDKSSLMKVV
jgi:hypothetical protein